MDNIGSRIAYFLVEKVDPEGGSGKGFTPDQPSGDVSVEEQLTQAGLVSPEQFRSLAEEFFGTPFASQPDFPKEPICSIISQPNS